MTMPTPAPPPLPPPTTLPPFYTPEPPEIERIEVPPLPTLPPIPPLPYIPQTWARTCPHCGMDFSGVTGYVCSYRNCPIMPPAYS